MEFEKWSSEAIPAMAAAFAKCADAKKIEEALHDYHLAWVGEVKDRLEAKERVDRVAKRVNNLAD